MLVNEPGRSVSCVLANRFLSLAHEARRRDADMLARTHFLTAIRHDPSPRSGIEFSKFLVEQQQLEDAATVLNDAWQQSKRLGDLALQAETCRRLATVYETLQQPSQARRFLQRAADAEMRSWKAVDSGFSFHQLVCESRSALADRDIRRARTLALGALATAKSDERSTALLHLSRIERRHGDPELAARKSLEALKSARAANDQAAIFESLVELGHGMARLHRPELAAESYQAASTLFAWNRGHVSRKELSRWLRDARIASRPSNGEWN